MPSRVPSGDQRGCASFLPVVNLRGGSEPSVFAIQIDWRYAFSSLVDRPDDVRDVVTAGPQARVGDPVSW